MISSLLVPFSVNRCAPVWSHRPFLLLGFDASLFSLSSGVVSSAPVGNLDGVIFVEGALISASCL